MSEKTEDLKRKNVRFDPDGNTLVWLSYHKDPKEFCEEKVGIVVSEGFGGVGAVFFKLDDLKELESVTIKVGNMAPCVAQIRWISDLGADIKKVGFQYLDEE